jgi:lauroyl/myristoyl acyltransferase
MEKALYWLARAVVALLQALPLRTVARLGRAGGGLAYWLDARHRRVALRNLAMCFGQEKPAVEIRALARENFRRIGECFASAAKTAALSFEELRPHVEFAVPAEVVSPPGGRNAQGLVVAIGHFGNFELYTRLGQFAPAYRPVTTYRGLRQPSLNGLLQSLRERSGCAFFERRSEAALLRAFMSQGGAMLGLLCDQHAGDGGLRLPFLGHECSTSVAPAIFALRYDCVLRTAICYRIGLARWRIEVGDAIPIRDNGAARTSGEIMREVNKAFEAAVRRDPANWFWVHNRWKPGRARVPQPAAANGLQRPEAARMEE